MSRSPVQGVALFLAAIVQLAATASKKALQRAGLLLAAV
jgi:hypothetical protein